MPSGGTQVRCRTMALITAVLLSAFWLESCQAFVGGASPTCSSSRGLNIFAADERNFGGGWWVRRREMFGPREPRRKSAAFSSRKGRAFSPHALRMSDGDGDEGEKEFPLSQSMSIEKALGTDNPEEMFRMTDCDGSGGLDFDEFSSVFGGLGMGLGYAEMRALFDEMDLNKDGIISFEEFKTRMEKDLVEAQDAAIAATKAVVAEQETEGLSDSADDGSSRKSLELAKSKAEEAQRRVEDIQSLLVPDWGEGRSTA